MENYISSDELQNEREELCFYSGYDSGYKAMFNQLQELKKQIERMKHCSTCNHNLDERFNCYCLRDYEETKKCMRENLSLWELKPWKKYQKVQIKGDDL